MKIIKNNLAKMKNYFDKIYLIWHFIISSFNFSKNQHKSNEIQITTIAL